MRYVVALSGGMDSTVLATALLEERHSLVCVGVDYGQRHRRELVAAQEVCKCLGVPYEVLPAPFLAGLLPGSALTDSKIPVPHGHYADAGMRATVVPNRNMIILSLLLGVSVARGMGGVAIAAHAGDHAVYPDCREAFLEAMQGAARLCDYSAQRIEAPFARITKSEICAIGAKLEAPLHLTWSCYEGGDLHCGKCGTCVERREAFDLAGVKDPTEYAQ